MEDQRTYLKVKIKSLAEEAKIIRKEENGYQFDRDENGRSARQIGLKNHRKGIVASEARHALIAYGFIRGLRYRQVENDFKHPPNWERVKRMVLKYGTRGYDNFWTTKEKEESVLKKFEEWITEE